MNLTSLLAALNTLLDGINGLIKMQVEEAKYADVADTLDGQNKDMIVNEAIGSIGDHIEQSTNPHNTTLEDLNSVSRSYIDNGMAGSVFYSALSISQYGDMGSGSMGIAFSGWDVNFTQPIPAYIQGVYGIVPAQTIRLSELDAVVANSTWHVYLHMTVDGLEYRVTKDVIAESLSVMWLGAIFTGPSSVVGHSIDRVARIGTNRISRSPRGSSIPTTGGNANVSQRMDLGWIQSDQISSYVAHDHAGLPVIAVMDSNVGGRIVYDSAFAKLGNQHWSPDYTDFDSLSTVFKYLYNAIHWVADPLKTAVGNRKVLALTVGKPGAQWWAKGTLARDAMFYTLNGWMDVAGFDLTIVDPSDYDGEWVDATLEELEEYCAVVVISNRMSKVGSLTEQCVSNIIRYREQGGGLIIFGENSTSAVGEIPSLEAAQAETTSNHWPATANQIATRFGAWFSGDHGDPSINIGYTRATYGDHPLYNGMDDSENLDLGPSIARVHLAQVL